MAYFVNKDQFVGMLSITFENGSYFDDFAEQWEPTHFEKLFGKALWDSFLVDPTSETYTLLINECKQLFKWFFYFDYVIYLESFQSTIGSQEADAEHSQRAQQSRNYKAVRAWNHGRDLYPFTWSTLSESGLYPDLGDQATIVTQNVWAI